MENTTPQHTQFSRLMLFILATVLLVASIVGYFASRTMQSNTSVLTTAPSPTFSPTPTLIPYPIKGNMVLRLPQGKVRAGDLFSLDVVATSGKDTVAGFDIVLTYDTQRLQQEAFSTSSPAFQLFSYKRPHHLALSATKNLNTKGDVRFAQTSIARVTFRAQEKGVYTFSLKPVGNESSKFVSEAAAVTYPETTDIRLEIE